MIKIFSGIVDWNFGSQVEEWLKSLGNNYEVYDCAITSSYDSDGREVYVTAVFFYRIIKTNLEYNESNLREALEEEFKRDLHKELNKADEEFLKHLNKPKVNVNSKIPAAKNYGGLLDALWDLFEEEDKSEPYARGKMRR